MKSDNNKEFSVNRHSCYILKYHLVVVTKYRHPVIVPLIAKSLYEIAHDVFEQAWGCHIISMKADPEMRDHLHIMFEAPPQVQLSGLINNFKTVSSRRIRKEYADFLKPYYWKPVFWSRSYFVGCVSDVTEEIITSYISNQGKR